MRLDSFAACGRSSTIVAGVNGKYKPGPFELYLYDGKNSVQIPNENEIDPRMVEMQEQPRRFFKLENTIRFIKW